MKDMDERFENGSPDQAGKFDAGTKPDTPEPANVVLDGVELTWEKPNSILRAVGKVIRNGHPRRRQ